MALTDENVSEFVKFLGAIAKSEIEHPITQFFPACLDELWTTGCPNKETGRKYIRAVCLWFKGHWKTEGKDFLTARGMEIIEAIEKWNERNKEPLGEEEIGKVVMEVIHGNRSTISCEDLKKDLIFSFYCDTSQCYYDIAKTAMKDNRYGIELNDICNIQVVNRGKDNEREEFTFSLDLAADALINAFDIIATPDEKIWVYQNGVYNPRGDIFLCQILDRIAGDLASMRNQRETMRAIFLRCLEDYSVFDPDPCIFGVQNGVIDMRNGTFAQHDPKYKLTQLAPVVYDPSAQCPEIEKFLTTCLDPHDVKTLLDIFAAKTTRLVFEYFSPWIGRGQNGKTKCEDLIRSFWGDDATTEVEISTLGKNRFDLAELRGKRWLINSEVAGGQKESRWIKVISGGGKLTADQKGREHLEFRANCFIIFDCNNPPRFSDNTHGFSRRIVPIVWPISFVDNPKKPHERQRDPDILDKITTQDELSGLLNVLIKVAPDVIRTKTIYRKDDGETSANDYDLRSSTTESFWERFCEVSDEEDTSSLWLYQKYCQFCEIIGSTAKRDREFNTYGRKELKLKKGRASTAAGYVQAWKGLSFNEDSYNEFLLSIAGSKATSLLPTRDQQEPVTGPSRPSRPTKNVLPFEEELKKIFSIKVIANSAGLAGIAGQAIDSAGQNHDQHTSNEPQSLEDLLSELTRRGVTVRTSDLPGEDEMEKCEALDKAGWIDDGRGNWRPPSRL